MPQTLPTGTTFGVTGYMPSVPGHTGSDIYGFRTPDYQGAMLNQQRSQSAQMFPMQLQMMQQKLGLTKNLMGMLGGMFGGSGNSSFSASRGPMPPPRYVSAGPVWSQGQIDAQAGLQRAGLMQQAGSQTNAFTNQLGARGFSPMGALGGIMGQQNMMRANAGAAANETGLNFTAAKANSDARLQAGGINAGVYGDYLKSMLGYDTLNADTQFKSRQLSQQLLSQILGALG